MALQGYNGAFLRHDDDTGDIVAVSKVAGLAEMITIRSNAVIEEDEGIKQEKEERRRDVKSSEMNYM